MLYMTPISVYNNIKYNKNAITFKNSLFPCNIYDDHIYIKLSK